MTNLTPERMAEIRARCEEATPGPWEAWSQGSVKTVDVRVPDTRSYARKNLLIQGHYANPRDTVFVAHAREDIPELLAEVERLRALLNAYRNIIAEEGLEMPDENADRNNDVSKA